MFQVNIQLNRSATIAYNANVRKFGKDMKLSFMQLAAIVQNRCKMQIAVELFN